MKDTTETMVMESACTHPNAGWKIVNKPLPGGFGETRITCKCPDCGEDVWVMANKGPAPEGVIAWRWGKPEEMLARAAAKPNGTKQQPKPKPTQADRVAQAEQDIVTKLGGDGVGTRLALRFFRAGYVASCSACDAAAKNMNSLGPAGCREQMDALVEEMLPRAEEWLKKSHPLAQKLGAVVGVDKPLIRRELRKDIEAAIADVETGSPL